MLAYSRSGLNARFVWDPEQEKVLQQIQAAGQAALPFGPCNLADPADPVVLVVSVADKAAI